jgi:glycosyltransferase involved in cell wall biosynthesis
MNILFIHRSFMGQFKYLATVLSLDANNNVTFLTEDDEYNVQGIKKVVYRAKCKPSGNFYLENYEVALERAQSAAKKAEELKKQGFKPDIIYGFAGWGSSMFIKDVFPDVPFIAYCEWFLNSEGANIGFDGTEINLEEKERLRCNNAHILTTLAAADAGISPTQWQKDRFPKEFHDKISVIHDGVDTGLFVPDENVKFTIKNTMENGKCKRVTGKGERGTEKCHCEESCLQDDVAIQEDSSPEFQALVPRAEIQPSPARGEGVAPPDIQSSTPLDIHSPFTIHHSPSKTLELTRQNEVITYGTRGFEPTRGFPQFMEAAEKLLKNRPNLHILIAGENKVHYSAQKNVDYKALMLKNLDLDMSRVHFVGTLTYNEYKKFLQVSSAHVYLTYPFILSWSILDAMSAGCCIVASNTAPVLEVIEDNYNGLLVDFFNIDELVAKLEYALNNKEKMQKIRQNARQSVVEKYDLAKVVPMQIMTIQKVIGNW